MEKITPLEKSKLERSKRFWSLVIYIPVAVVILWVLFGVFTEVVGFSAEWNETFENFDLGTINGQGKWTAVDYPDVYLVSATNPYAGSQHLKIWNTTSGYRNATPNFFTADTEITTGIVEWSFKVQMKRWVDPCYAIFTLRSNGGERWAFLMEDQPGNEYLIRYRTGGDFFGGKRLIKDDSWATIKVTLDLDTRWVYLDVNYKGEDWTQYSVERPDMEGIKSLGFECFNCGLDIDNMEYSVPPLVPKVWAISPASETEITDLETAFTFGWEDLDDDDSLSVVFHNRPTGIFSQAKAYEIETIGVAGTKELSFTDFNFDRNGKFYFYAITSKYTPTVIEGMYLTGGYSYEWSEDLVDPEHWFTINIEELTAIFEMSDFETWYSEESKFATPTAMFVSMTGFFEPIFNKIGEFGSRIMDYFDVSEAYGQGYEIGKAIPYFAFFVGQTTLFLGGFPILKWLFVIMLLLVGIFIFRLILKFIPGLG